MICRSPEEDALRQEAVRQLGRILLELKARDERVIRLRYGLGREPMTFGEIGLLFGISSVRVQQLEMRAIRYLKHPSKRLRLPHPREISDD